MDHVNVNTELTVDLRIVRMPSSGCTGDFWYGTEGKDSYVFFWCGLQPVKNR